MWAVGRVVGAELIPDTMVPLMLYYESVWKHIESYLTLVMRKKDLDERRECHNGESQYKWQQGLTRRRDSRSDQAATLVVRGIFMLS